MKKIYDAPETKVIKVKLATIIAASNPAVTADPDATPIDAGEVESRRYNIWDDEEDEENNP